VVITGVGSVRWRVSYHGPGGHAWERSQAPSAVHAAAQASALLTGLAVAGARCSVNIGTIGGGEAINARAREAWFEVDLRADSAPGLASRVGQAGRTGRAADDQIRVSIDEIGSRPAGGIAESSALARAAVAGHERAGVPAELRAASTDANAAYAAGIPAVALGVTRGEGEHTPGEWIQTAPVADGLGVLAETIRLFREGQPGPNRDPAWPCREWTPPRSSAAGSRKSRASASATSGSPTPRCTPGTATPTSPWPRPTAPGSGSGPPSPIPSPATPLSPLPRPPPLTRYQAAG